MIACTSCHNTLPDWAQKCQFCGADVTKVARPAGDRPKSSAPLTKAASWIWPVYYALCAYWVISGLSGIFETYHVAVTPVTTKFLGITTTETPGFGFWSIIGFGIGAFSLLVGIGLALRVEIARGVANFLAALNILFGLAGLAGSLAGTAFVGGLGFILALKHTLDIIVGAMTIYLIGETEKNAPNF